MRTTPFTSFSSSSPSPSSGNRSRRMKPQKHKCSSKCRDRLSEMPDDVLVHILSYLSILDAVRTMLIRPFGTLWTLVPTLDFDLQKVGQLDPDGWWDSDDVSRFFIFVRNVLKLHRRPFIDEFCLTLFYQHQPHDQRSECGDDIRMCLKFALDKQAKEIYFRDGNEDLAKSSDYPNFISQSLVSLELRYCAIFPELQVDLGSLEVLILNFVEMSEVTFQQFICGCPSLQVLHIYDPKYIRNLSFSAPNIHTLFLEFEEDEPDDDRWLFNFSNLQSLDLELYRIPDVIEIDVSSVRDVYIREFRFEIDDENKLGMFKLFLEKFSQSEVFSLSDSAADSAEPFLHLLDDLHLLQIRWKRVVLPLPIFCQSCLLGVCQLMRNAKYLEKLDIYTNTTSAMGTSVDLPLVGLSDPCVMPKLKTVTLHGYAKPWKHQLQLVKFLLKNAIVLENLVFVPKKPQLTVKEKLDFVMRVSRFQRSSPRASILFL